MCWSCVCACSRYPSIVHHIAHFLVFAYSRCAPLRRFLSPCRHTGSSSPSLGSGQQACRCNPPQCRSIHTFKNGLLRGRAGGFARMGVLISASSVDIELTPKCFSCPSPTGCTRQFAIIECQLWHGLCQHARHPSSSQGAAKLWGSSAGCDQL